VAGGGLARPVATDDRDLSAARQRADEEVLEVPPAASGGPVIRG